MKRVLAVIGLCLVTATAAQEQPSFALDEMTIAQLQDSLVSGRFTSRQLVELYSKRIEEIDVAGPTLRSVIELNPDALTLADALDAERRAGKTRGALHGIPILVKDNIDTGDRMLTTAGSLALADAPALRDAFIVERLRAAGAIVLGKTNLSEWANFRSTKSTSGWSARGGQVRNPTCWTAIPVDRARAVAWPWQRTLPQQPSEPRPTDRSSVPLRRTGSLASSRRLDW